MLRLILPDTRYWDSYMEAMYEGYNYSDYTPKTDAEIAAIDADPHAHLEEENYQGGFFTPEDGIERKRVAHNKYWLMDGDVFIGAAWLRYELNDFLEKYAGHIGYGIRPSKRKQGYATKLVGLSLSKLKQRGVSKALITASEDNVGSWKAIEANGGKQTGTVDNIFNDGQGLIRQYWIELEGMCG